MSLCLFVVVRVGFGEARELRIVTPDGVSYSHVDDEMDASTALPHKKNESVCLPPWNRSMTRNQNDSIRYVELLPFRRRIPGESLPSHCSELSDTEAIEERERWIRSHLSQRRFEEQRCREELEFELREEWMHTHRVHLCDFASYSIPTFQQYSFLSSPFATSFAPPGEDSIRIAFFIVAYRQPKFLTRLVNRLQTNDRRHMILIHIDSHATKQFEYETLLIVSSYPNVRVVRWGTMVYGSSTAVQTICAGMKWFYDNHFHSWDFFVPLTGQDYPLLPASTLAKTLARNGHRSWIVGEDMSAECASSVSMPLSTTLLDQWGRMTTLNYPCTIGGSKSVHRIKHRSPWLFGGGGGSKSSKEKKIAASSHLSVEKSEGLAAESFRLRFCKGTTMSTGIFHRDAVGVLTRDPRALKAFAFFRLSIIPEEHYWISVLSSLGTFAEEEEDGRPLLLRKSPCEMAWKRGYGADGIHNTFLTMKEKDIIDDAVRKGRIFARKFDEAIDSSILDYIDSIEM